jgi:hypothetical protein
MLDIALHGLAFFAGAGLSLQGNTGLRLLSPTAMWVGIDRLFAVVDARKTADICYRADLATYRYLKSLRLPDPKGEVKARTVARFGADYDEIWDAVRSRFLVAAHRTSRFMNWRYLDHPRFRYNCIECETRHGWAYYVWREEVIYDTTAVVIRLCDVIGFPLAITQSFAVFMQHIWRPQVLFVDFFCSNGEINGALIAGGMHPVIVVRNFDLPRLFQPLEPAVDQTLDFYYLFADAFRPRNYADVSKCYFTKGDTNQDRPNIVVKDM